MLSNCYDRICGIVNKKARFLVSFLKNPLINSCFLVIKLSHQIKNIQKIPLISASQVSRKIISKIESVLQYWMKKTKAMI